MIYENISGWQAYSLFNVFPYTTSIFVNNAYMLSCKPPECRIYMYMYIVHRIPEYQNPCLMSFCVSVQVHVHGWVGYFTFLFFLISLSVLCTCISMYVQCTCMHVICTCHYVNTIIFYDGRACVSISAYDSHILPSSQCLCCAHVHTQLTDHVTAD